MGQGNAAHAEERAVRLGAWWGGLHAADIYFASRRDGGDYGGELDIRSRGALEALSGLHMEASGRGRVTSSGLAPQHYDQHTESRRLERVVQVDLGAGGTAHIVRDQDIRRDEPDDDPPPPVPADLLKDVLDPVTAILTLGRRGVAGEKNYVVPVYDGRRRYDLAVGVTGPGRHDIDGRGYDTLDLKVVVKPRGGFTDKQLGVWRDALFTVYAAPSDGLPLKIDTDSFVAGLVISIQATCPPAGNCALPPKS